MTEPTLPEWLKLNKASGFPENWRALCDDLAVRVAKDPKQFRPTAVSILVAHSRRRMVIRVLIRPRATPGHPNAGSGKRTSPASSGASLQLPAASHASSVAAHCAAARDCECSTGANSLEEILPSANLPFASL